MQNLNLLKYLSVFLLLSVSHSANATMMFDVTSATGTDAACPHGLWTNNKDYYSGDCGNRYDINAWLTVYDEAPKPYAKLWGSASNGYSVAKIDLTFKDFAEEHSYKKEGGADYDRDKVDFFETVMGTITIYSGPTTTDSHIYDIDYFAGGYAFQFGYGASAKDPYVYGASSWVQSCQVGKDAYCMKSHHWDLNLDITKKVPEPSVIALFAVGLIGLGFARRRMRS